MIIFFFKELIEPPTFYFGQMNRENEVLDWLIEHTDGGYKFTFADGGIMRKDDIEDFFIRGVQFKNESDAIAFKLRFGI